MQWRRREPTTITWLTEISSEDRWCWQSPLPQGNWLRSAWRRGPNDVLAVGDDCAVLHYDGRRRPRSTPNGALEQGPGAARLQ
jgi:hypothetical protein